MDLISQTPSIRNLTAGGRMPEGRMGFQHVLVAVKTFYFYVRNPVHPNMVIASSVKQDEAKAPEEEMNAPLCGEPDEEEEETPQWVASSAWQQEMSLTPGLLKWLFFSFARRRTLAESPEGPPASEPSSGAQGGAMGSLLRLGLVPLLLLLLRGSGALASAMARSHVSPSSHSLRYYYTAVSKPSESLPQFIILGYVDDQLISRYDSYTKKKQPGVPWMKKVEEHYPSYWEEGTRVSENTERFFRESLVTARNRFNQSGGFHCLQEMYGCELRKDGSKGGFWKYAYEGKDYISLDKETLTWTAADLPAQITKRKWDAEPTIAWYWKAYLEEECIEWLQKYLEYGKEMLPRTDPPKVKLTRKADYDNMETLICRVDGFYPKDIDIAWTKDGEVWMEGTFSGLVSPNSDGTYYTWLSIKIDPKDRERYKCRVEHDGLPEHVDLAWEEPASSQRLTIACMTSAVFLVAGIAGIVLITTYIKERQDGYKSASESDQGFNGTWDREACTYPVIPNKDKGLICHARG